MEHCFHNTIYPLFKRLLLITFQKSKLRLVFPRFIRGTFYEIGQVFVFPFLHLTIPKILLRTTFLWILV